MDWRATTPEVMPSSLGETMPFMVSLALNEWRHINRVLAACDGNVSLAARTLRIHRRTLQRKLQKKPR
jgi:two-component system response regulator RegA